MKRYGYIFILLLITSINLSNAQQIGEWRAFMAYHDASRNIPVGNKVYVLSDGSLYSYDKDDTSIRTYDNTNILTDNSIICISYNKQYKTLIIIYENSNIDLLVDDEYVYNIPDFMNKSMLQDKKLNSIFLRDEYAYLSTNFGIVILNIKKREITNSYVLDKKVNSSVVANNTIYAATDKGVLTGLLTDNLLDNDLWKNYSSAVFNDLIIYNNSILGYMPGTLYKFNLSNDSFDQVLKGDYSFFNVCDDKLLVGNSNSVTIFNNNTESYIQIQQNENFKYISYNKNNDIYWASNGDKGLNGYKHNKDNNKLEKVIQSIIPDSPKRNLFEYSTFNNNFLLVAGGGIDKNRYNNPGTIMIYKNGKWTSFPEEGISESTGVQYKDITYVIQDPRDPDHFFATSAGEGLYEFKDNKFVKLYTEGPNSPLKSVGEYGANYVRVNGLQFDKDNNLWVMNSSVDNIINILKNDNKWVSLYYPDIANKALVKRTMFDSRGWAWISVSTWQNPGLFILDTNGTLENTKDDKTKFFPSFTNQDGTVLGDLSVFCVIEDKNGTIWVGTEYGPLIINNPTKIFDENFYFTQIKIPRNDGTNNADFLLNKEQINVICIDGANRKWIGSGSNGVFLLSEDGLQTIHHFNTENSPLLSDNILSISIDPESGNVFIGTDKGLITYKSDATEGGSSFSDEAHVYPNPVRPDYEGVITVTGLVKDSDVKITDTNGNLIHTGTSLGGQFSWNGKNKSGKRAASGVYFVLAVNKEGKEGVVTKILMIK